MSGSSTMTGFTELNRQVFDKMARSYKVDFASVLETLYRQVQNHRLWASDTWTDTEAGQGREIKVLDYACGPGIVSTALAPFVTKIVGLDFSDEMIKEYNANAREAGFADKMVGYKGDLLAETVSANISGPEFTDFDIVVVSMALHHFEKPDFALKRFSERLKKGGVCIIIDIVLEDKHNHLSAAKLHHEFSSETSATIKTHGFTLEDMRKLYEDAGIGMKFDYQVIEEPLVMHNNGKTISKTIFVARAQHE